jgi:hypothetical protein
MTALSKAATHGSQLGVDLSRLQQIRVQCRLAEMPTHRRVTFAIFSILAISACTNSTPPIARDLPRAFGPTSDFDRRIQQRFPVSSDETVLVAELRKERFSIDETPDRSGTYRHSAHYVRQDIACRTSWTIRWNGEQGKIIKIEGRYSGEICL